MSFIKKPTKKQSETQQITPTPAVISTIIRRPCSSRNKMQLKEILKKEPNKINLLLARALLNDDLLDLFATEPHANECVFSYPNSDWYSVYFKDADGNIYWDAEVGTMKLYFKIEISPSGKDATIIKESMTSDVPRELIGPDGNELPNCVFNQKGNCVNPEGRKSSRQPGTETQVPTPVVLPESVQTQLDKLVIGGGSIKVPKTKVTREYFEQLKSKELIIDWMVKHMSREDLVKCIQRGALSSADVKSAEQLTTPVTDDIVYEQVTQAVRDLPSREINKMIKKVSASEIVSQIKSIPEEEEKLYGSRSKNIINLCRRTRVPGKFTVAKNSKGVWQIYRVDETGKRGAFLGPAVIDKLLGECARAQAITLSRKIAVISAAKERQAERIRKGKSPLVLDSDSVQEELYTLPVILALTGNFPLNLSKHSMAINKFCIKLNNFEADAKGNATAVFPDGTRKIITRDRFKENCSI